MTDLAPVPHPSPAHVTQLAPVALAGFGRDLVCCWANPRFADLVGLSACRLPGTSWDDLLPTVSDQEREQVGRVLGGTSPGANLEITIVPSREGVVRSARTSETWRLHVYPLTLGDRVNGVGVVGVDVTDDLVQLADLRRRADVDGLTGLLNRSAFHAHLRGLVGRGATAVRPRLLVVDLNGFKQVNDTYGHAAGDAVLAEVGRRLRGMLAEGEVAGRLGGDEFAVVAVEPVEQGRTRLVSRVRRAVSRPIELGPGCSVPVTVAIGQTTVSSSASIEDVLAAADTAMYEVKRRRRAGDRPQAARVLDLHGHDHHAPADVFDPVLDRACGLIMGRSGCSERQALGALARIARATSRTLLDVAADLDRAAGRPGRQRLQVARVPSLGPSGVQLSAVGRASATRR